MSKEELSEGQRTYSNTNTSRSSEIHPVFTTLPLPESHYLRCNKGEDTDSLIHATPSTTHHPRNIVTTYHEGTDQAASGCEDLCLWLETLIACDKEYLFFISADSFGLWGVG